MGYLVLKRLLALVLTMIGVSLVVFLMVQVVPGDTVTALLGPNATPETRQRLTADLGLDRPIQVQYGKWFWRTLQLDLGRSIAKMQPVFFLVTDAFRNTLVLAAASIVIAVAVGFAVGITSATRQYSFYDRGGMLGALFATSMPSFWFGMVLIMAFSLALLLFPSGGMYQVTALTKNPLDLLHHLVLPAICTAAVPGGILARSVRSSMLEVIRQDFVRTLRAKGVPERYVIGHHVVKNAFPNILTMIGLQLGYLLGGAVFVEVVFSWPGVGLLIYQSIAMRDLPVIQGGVLVVSLFFVVINIIVDLVVPLVDPRVKQA